MNFTAFLATADPEVGPLADAINAACKGSTVEPCFLAAIIKRESNGRNILQEGVPPGPGCGVGPTQITYDVDWKYVSNPTFKGIRFNKTYRLMKITDNLECAVKEFLEPLVDNMTKLRKSNPLAYQDYAEGQILIGVAAAYNAGYNAVADAILSGEHVDEVTENSNYATDVYDHCLQFLIASAHK
jgi:hypothetical protein